ncbi:MAG: glycosyltransferase [Myxococcota bacterium]
MRIEDVYQKLRRVRWRPQRVVNEAIKVALAQSTSTDQLAALLDDIERACGRIRYAIGGRSKRRFTSFEQYERWAALHRFCHAGEYDLRELYSFFQTAKCLYESRSTSQPRVSFIIPTRNRAGLVRNAIQSILREPYEHLEIIVIDDGSTDSTCRDVESIEDSRLILTNNTKHPGVSGARNTGLRRATGEWIFYLDSDNEFRTGSLTALISAVEEAKSEQQCFFFAQEVIESRRGKARTRGIRYGPFNRSLLENHNYIDINAFVHHRELYEVHGGFNPDLRRLVDYDLVLRYTASNGASALPILGSLYLDHESPDRITNSVDLETARREDSRLNQRERLDLAKADGCHSFFAPATEKRKSTPRPVNVIIPNFECVDTLDLALSSLRQYSPSDVSIVVVDNGSSRAVKEYLKSSPYGASTILNNENMGFTYAVNQGLKEFPEGDIVLFNNDAIATPGWLEGFWEVLDKFESVGLVVPRQVLLPGRETTLEHVPTADLAIECDVNLSLHHRNIQAALNGGFYELSYAPFFCVYITEEVRRELPRLDEQRGRHYGSDRFYCDAVRLLLGQRVVYTPYTKVYHLLQASTERLRAADGEAFSRMFVANEW